MVHKICSIMGTPTQATWPEGIKLASSLNMRLPQFSPTPLSKVIPGASRDAIDLITSMCQWDPNKRPTALQCLQHPYFQVSYLEMGSSAVQVLFFKKQKAGLAFELLEAAACLMCQALSEELSPAARQSV